ncbi:MAG: ABC transporter ATP-binding protein/permease [Lachnospiraceae bacterium]|nr:ABC transporter ATP-binding protein/permease [Lachnospiraceae bacterium]
MIKKLLQSLREYRKNTVLAPVFVIVEVVMEILIPYIMARLIDNGIEPGNMSVILKIGVLLLVVAFISLAFGALAGQQAAIASSGLAKNLRKDMYTKVQEYSFSNIDKFSTASIVTRLTTDVTNVQNAFQMTVRTAARCPVMLIAAIVVSFTINRRLAMIFVAVVPILAVVLAFISIYVHPYFKRVFNTYDELNLDVQENLYGIRVVKSYIREDYENNKFKKISQSIYKDFVKAEKTITMNMPVMMAAVYVCILLVAWLGAKTIVLSGNVAGVANGLTTGELMSLFTYAMQILMSLMMLAMVAVMIIMSLASGNRIVEILEEESDIQNRENPVTEVKDGTITFENVNFRYSEEADRDVLSNINLEIRSGERVGVIGGTGSAKSSLVQLIPRLYDVTEGCVKVGGVDVRDYDLETLRNEVAMVLQKNILFSGTIKDNLRWGKEDATDEEIIRACKQAQADEFIERMPDKYDTWIEQGGANVSGGQRQRLCIARALLKKPKILILDDSTSAVDTKTDLLIRKAFAEEIPDTTKFIITQRISSVDDADKIIVMDDGKILAVGTHEELLKTSTIYRETFESQQKGGGLSE